jgi:predicted nucleotidyltransferase
MESSGEPLMPGTGLADVFRHLEGQLAAACRAHFGPRLVGVVVYGSVARGTMRADSDLDVMVVLENLPPTAWERLRQMDPVEEAMEPALAEARRAGVETELSPVVKSPEDLEQGFLLMLDMTEEARILWDPERRVSRALDAFRQRLVKAGARRIRTGTSGYWDLKPDFVPGDRVLI